MLDMQTQPAVHARTNRYEVSIARTHHEIEEAQRLRYQVFFGEMGAAAARPAEDGRDMDQYDADCDHLLVRESQSGAVVGCYRIMRPEMARRRGEYYADSEFDLGRLAPIRGNAAEVGRACIHPAYRSGTVIMLLWSELTRHMIENRHEYVFGCASIPLADGHDNVIAVYEDVIARSLVPAEYRVFPKNPYPLNTHRNRHGARGAPQPVPRVPALIKGYMRLGAWIGGAPAWDPDFNTADLFVLLPIARMADAYTRHFLRTT